MDTLGPVSVLDSGRRTRDMLVADRITRRRSPDRPRLKTALSEMDVVYRIPQPYRTSFSAKHSVERLPGSDRSRSLSPATSLRSLPSARSAGGGVRRPHNHGRSKSPKRVTYDTRVTVRRSDGPADDSLFAELSGRDLPPASPQRSPVSVDLNQLSKDSGLDYSTEIRDLSDQISKMDWSGRNQSDSGLHHSPHGILKESQNSPKPVPPGDHQPQGVASLPRRSPPCGRGDKENTPNGAPPHKQPAAGDAYLSPKVPHTIQRDYQHERTFSYRHAVTDHYGTEVRALVEAGVQEKPPPAAEEQENGRLQAQQRSSSVSAVSSRAAASPTSSKLTPAKRSVSTSIGNFFKRISPHLGRKRGAANDRSNNGSRSGSSQSLPASSPGPLPPSEPGGDTTPSPQAGQAPPTPSSAASLRSDASHFSRNRIRKSFLKLVGGHRKDSKTKVAAAVSSSTPTVPEATPTAVDPASTGDTTERSLAAMPESAQRKLKTLSLGQKDVYREFKDKRAPAAATGGGVGAGGATGSGAESSLEERYRAIKAQYKDRPRLDDAEALDDYDGASGPPARTVGSRADVARPSGSQTRGEVRLPAAGDEKEEKGDTGRAGKTEPPSTLDVVPPRLIRLLQASTFSTISADESIGDCSLDCNLTASQPSLLSGISQSVTSTVSKKVLINQPIGSTDSSITDATDSTPVVRRTKDALILGQRIVDAPTSDCVDKENAQPLSPVSPADPSRKPSYLKLSCAVSGYGKYSRYSSYKNIPMRSPFSSTSSLRSDLSSPDFVTPASLHSPSNSGPSERLVKSAGCSPLGTAAMAAAALTNGHRTALNGLTVAQQAPGMYPTGDPVKDGDYFLAITASEEERLNQQAKLAEGLMRSQDLPEEVNGRIRAAIGKSNLLISQKFQQFRELCSQHMHPEPEDRVPLYEDLQGFWDMVKIQVDSVDDHFAEIDHMSQNGWKEIPRLVPSRRSSASSSPKSGSQSLTSTPSATPGHTPGSKRRGLKAGNRDTPDSSPEHAQKVRSAAKARDDARKKMLAEKRAAMKQQQQQQQQELVTPEVEIYLPDSTKLE